MRCVGIPRNGDKCWIVVIVAHVPIQDQHADPPILRSLLLGGALFGRVHSTTEI